MRRLTLVLLSFVCLACERKDGTSDDKSHCRLDIRLEASVENCVKAMRKSTKSIDEAGRCMDVINQETNLARRVQCIDAWVDRMLKEDVGSMSYGELRAYVQSLGLIGQREVSSGLLSAHADLVHIYDVQLRIIEWTQAAFARIRPTRNVGNAASRIDDATLHEWRTCYMSLYWTLVYMTGRLELEFDVETNGIESIRRPALRKMVEKRLAHPIRSPEEIHRAHYFETDEYKAVKSWSVTP